MMASRILRTRRVWSAKHALKPSIYRPQRLVFASPRPLCTSGPRPHVSRDHLRAVRGSSGGSSSIIPRSTGGALAIAFALSGLGAGGFYIYRLQGVCLSVAKHIHVLSEAGMNLGDVLEEYLERFRNMGFGQHADPDRESFSPSALRARPLPLERQDGVRDEPVVTVVLQLEGLLVKKEYDRRAGRRHMARAHLPEFLDSLAKSNPFHVNAWFWSEDSTMMGEQVMDGILTMKENGKKVPMQVVQMLEPVLLGKEHLFLEEGKLVKRLQPLPRYTPSTLLVATDEQSYRANPTNTILLPPVESYDVKDRALFTVVDFLRLFRLLHRSKKAKTPSEALAWIRSRHPEIDRDPAKYMVHAIAAETAQMRADQELVQNSSMGAALRRVQGDTLIGKGRAVSAGSTRYQKVHSGSIIDQRLKRYKELQQKAMAQQQENQ